MQKLLIAVVALVVGFVAGGRWTMHERRGDALIRDIDGVSVAPTADENPTATVTLHVGKQAHTLWLDTGYTQERSAMRHVKPGEPDLPPDQWPMLTEIVHGNVVRITKRAHVTPCGDRLPSTQITSAVMLDRSLVPQSSRTLFQCYYWEGTNYPPMTLASAIIEAGYR